MEGSGISGVPSRGCLLAALGIGFWGFTLCFERLQHPKHEVWRDDIFGSIVALFSLEPNIKCFVYVYIQHICICMYTHTSIDDR